jgi:hypothetical protein
VKHSTPEGIKFKKLQRRLNLPRYAVAGLLEMLWVATIKNAPRGDIGRFDNETIAIECDWSGDADELVNAFVEAKWLDRCEENRLVVHDWQDHAPYFVRGIAARQGGFIAAKESELKSELKSVTIVDDYSPGVAATKVDDYVGVQPNITQPNVTKPNTIYVDEFVSLWNSRPGIVKIRKLTGDRRQKLIARLADPDWPWREAIQKLPLPSSAGKTWQPDVDYFLRSERQAVGIVEGKFDWRGESGALVGPGQVYDPNADFGSDF